MRYVKYLIWQEIETRGKKPCITCPCMTNQKHVHTYTHTRTHTHTHTRTHTNKIWMKHMYHKHLSKMLARNWLPSGWHHFTLWRHIPGVSFNWLLSITIHSVAFSSYLSIKAMHHRTIVLRNLRQKVVSLNQMPIIRKMCHVVTIGSEFRE